MNTGKGKEAGGYWLEKNNSEYDQIHYYLKACAVDRGEIGKLEIWKIENLDFSFRYDRRTANMLKLATWTDSSSLTGGNTVESVCNQGFSFNRTLNNGLEFTNGVIDFSTLSDDAAKPKDFSLIYSEIAIGRSFVYDGDVHKTRQTQPCVPPGYDSLYLPSNPLDRDNDGKFSLTEYQAAANFDNRDPSQYRHKYFVQDPLQVNPKYIVRFRLTPNTKRMGSTKGTAPLYGQDLDGTAVDENDYVYYDSNSYTPITKEQRHAYNLSTSGSVTGGLSNNAALLPIETSFNAAVESHYQADPMVESKKAWLDKQLESVEDKVREVNLNYAEISEAIQEAAATATAKLQALTKQKLQTCLSVEIELRRQQEQLAWLDHAITAQLHATQKLTNSQGNILQNSSFNKKKLEFLKSYKYHTMFRNTLSRSKPNEIMALNSVYADIKINPEISIYLDPFYSAGGGTGGTGGSDENKGDNQSTASTVNRSAKQAQDPLFASDMYKYAADAVPTDIRPMNPIVASNVQSLFNSEMESITAAIQDAIDNAGSNAMPLPDSILRPMITGERYEPPVHELLKSLQYDGRDGTNNNGVSGGGGSGKFLGKLNSTLSGGFYPAHSPHGGGGGGMTMRDTFDATLRSAIGELPPAANSPTGTRITATAEDYLPSPSDTFATGSQLDYSNSYTPSPKRSHGHTATASGGGASNYGGGGGGGGFGNADYNSDGMGTGFPPGTAGTGAGAPPPYYATTPQAPPSVKSSIQQQQQQGAKSGAKRGTPGRASVIMHPPSHKKEQQPPPQQQQQQQHAHYPPPPDSPLSARSTQINSRDSPVAGDRLFHSSTLPGQTMKSLGVSQSQHNNTHNQNNNNSEIDLDHIHMSINQLLKATHSYSQHSLSDQAARKKRQLLSKQVTSHEEYISSICTESKIIGEDRSAVESVYFTLPFFAKPPQCKMMFSTEQHERSLSALYARTSKHRGPCFLLIRSGDFIFGAFLSHPLVPGDSWAGSPACYLFSVTLDLKLPYHARASSSEEFADVTSPLAYFIQDDSIFLGNGDLSIDGDIINGSSELENCYGVGFEQKSNEAFCVLAGAPLFEIDEMEVWAVVNN